MRVMYPVPQNASPVHWILAQVAAKCGVSNRQQLTDSLLHLITLDSNLSSPVSSSTTTNISSVSHSIPLQYHINIHPALSGPLAGFVSVINQSNSYSTNNSHLYTISANNLISGQCCGNSGVSGVGGASTVGGVELVSKQGDCQPQDLLATELFNVETSVERVLCLGGVHFRMVSPAGGQEALTVLRGSNSSSSSSSGNKNNNINSVKNRNNNNKTNNSNNNKNKELSLSKGVVPEDHIEKYCVPSKVVKPEHHTEKYCGPVTKYDVHVHDYLESVSGRKEENNKDDRFSQPQLPAPNKAVDAKEVEKLLQNALWKGSQQHKKGQDGGESTSSGGCDTGYSSRCSTPPGPSILSADTCPEAIDPKHGTKRHLDVPVSSIAGNTTRESRSESPGACSVSSQGSYRNPRQKRRYNNNADGHNAYYHNNHHHPSHHINYHHSQPHQHHHHHQNQHGGGYGGNNGGIRGNNQYYSYHSPDLANRDCTNYQGRRYERGYNNYNYYGQYEHHGRNFNHHGISDGRHGRFNQGRGYINRYNNHTNQYNNHCLPQNSENHRDQSRPLSDRAGTFSEERVSGNSRWVSEVVDTPNELVMGSEWDSISQQVWDTFKQHQQTNKTFLKKLRLKEKIFRIIRNVLPNCRLYVVGSSLSGFGADCSDVDMCLMVTPGDLDQRTEATAVLRLLQQELNHCGSIQKMELIRAKVPILKFRDSHSQVDVDLNCNNAVGIRNTHLLNSYSQLDWRVRPLVLVVKLWAQHHNINNAKDMTISSYSLVLMVIHYLQHGVEPPVLPCLQKTYPQKFRACAQITTIPVTERMPTFTSNNYDTLGKLFHGFLNYFANDFTFIEETISVRTGGTVPTVQCRSVRSRKNDARMWKYLCIEEPFDLTNTARSVYDEAVFERVKKVFVDSYKLLNEKRDLSSILS